MKVEPSYEIKTLREDAQFAVRKISLCEPLPRGESRRQDSFLLGENMETKLHLSVSLWRAPSPWSSSIICCTNTGAISSAEWGSLTGKKNVHIISVAIDAPQDVINALSGKIGRLAGITAKTVYSNV